MNFELRHTFLDSPQQTRFKLLASRYAAMGLGAIRYGPRWPEIEPEPGVYDFAVVDEAIDAIDSAGMQTYLNLTDVPGHALINEDGSAHPWEGYRTYFPEAISSTPFGRPTCWSKSRSVFDPLYDPDISSECANPPHIRKESVTNIARVLAARYGNKVRSWGIGNETDDPLFFPPMILTRTVNNGDWEPAVKRAYEELFKPFADGIHLVLPATVVEGTESQTYGYLKSMLVLEKSLGHHTFDAISTHGYAGPGNHFPDGAVERITTPNGGLFKYLHDFDVWDDRPKGIGEVAPETGDDPYGVLEYLPIMRNLGFWHVTLMMGSAFFLPDTFDNGSYEPNDLYEQVRRTMNRLTMRHRGVRSA